MKKMSSKAVIVALAGVLAIGGAAGATIAWLTDQTDPVKNTFTVGDIDITLTETTSDYKMAPGNKIAKDPTVTVEANSEACWLFVKVEESGNFDTYMTYAMATGWLQLEDANGVEVSGVYYREVAATSADIEFPVLAGNQVDVLTSVTKTQLEAADSNAPTLTFTAYAVQKDNVADSVAAWAIAVPTTTTEG